MELERGWVLINGGDCAGELRRRSFGARLAPLDSVPVSQRRARSRSAAAADEYAECRFLPSPGIPALQASLSFWKLLLHSEEFVILDKKKFPFFFLPIFFIKFLFFLFVCRHSFVCSSVNKSNLLCFKFQMKHTPYETVRVFWKNKYRFVWNEGGWGREYFVAAALSHYVGLRSQ